MVGLLVMAKQNPSVLLSDFSILLDSTTTPCQELCIGWKRSLAVAKDFGLRDQIMARAC